MGKVLVARKQKTKHIAIPAAIWQNQNSTSRRNTGETHRYARKENTGTTTPAEQGKIRGASREKNSQGNNIPEKLRIQLWNALIRSTQTYALQTQELTTAQERKINGFAQNCMREILMKTWYRKKPRNKTQIPKHQN